MRVGVLYQMLDDLLDYFPDAASDKTKNLDYATGHWTWVLDEIRAPVRFGRSASDIAALLCARDGAAPPESSPLTRSIRRYVGLSRSVERSYRRALPGEPLIPSLLAAWRDRAGRLAHDRTGNPTP
jgi:hypothetical protein